MKLFLTLSVLVIALQANITLPQNFESNFKQTITNENGKVIEYNGSVLFQNQHRSLFKWSYTYPTKKEVCTDGIQLIVVDHDLEQVSNYMVDEGINLEAVLNVAEKITSTDYKATYKEVEYLISVDTENQLNKIVYVDNLDNGVKIMFNNIQYNTNIDINLLECQAPQEYDIIEG
jgi:outer membrane lipoprotein carrier protein